MKIDSDSIRSSWWRVGINFVDVFSGSKNHREVEIKYAKIEQARRGPNAAIDRDLQPGIIPTRSFFAPTRPKGFKAQRLFPFGTRRYFHGLLVCWRVKFPWWKNSNS